MHISLLLFLKKMSILNGKLDVYNCFTIDHKQLPENIKEFESNLAGFFSKINIFFLKFLKFKLFQFQF